MRLLLLAVSFSLWLTACATFSPPVVRPPGSEIAQFSLLGRLAVRQGESRYHVSIDWRHAPDQDEILLATPLGQGVAELIRTPEGARLTLADKSSYTAADWSSLAERVFGFPLPLNNAVRWLLGNGTTERLSDGWTMRIVARESELAHALPTIVEMERDDTHVRIRIDEWTDVR